jgi:hypothetical protein
MDLTSRHVQVVRSAVGPGSPTFLNSTPYGPTYRRRTARVFCSDQHIAALFLTVVARITMSHVRQDIQAQMSAGSIYSVSGILANLVCDEKIRPLDKSSLECLRKCITDFSLVLVVSCKTRQ